jgi:hypothetical protein
MPCQYACCTFFYITSPEILVERYLQGIEPANGYLTQAGTWWQLVDGTAAETGNWARQRDIGTALSTEEGVALSVFIADEEWAISLSVNGEPGPSAVYLPDNAELLSRVPYSLMALEQALGLLFPDYVDLDTVDALLGALLEGALPPETAFTELFTMLGIPEDWLRWALFEAIPDQLILDPDLSDRVLPLGAAHDLWEE